MKSKADVEAEQNASSFTSTVSFEPSSMTILILCHPYTTHPDQVKVEKKKSSSKTEVQPAPGKQTTKAHPLMSSASLGSMPQR